MSDYPLWVVVGEIWSHDFIDVTVVSQEYAAPSEDIAIERLEYDYAGDLMEIIAVYGPYERSE